VVELSVPPLLSCGLVHDGRLARPPGDGEWMVVELSVPPLLSCGLVHDAVGGDEKENRPRRAGGF
jgi:hypothetical protein